MWQSCSLAWHVASVAVLSLFMMVDASVHTEDKLALLYVQKISLLLLFVAMDILSGRTNQMQDI